MTYEILQTLTVELERVWKETNELTNDLNNICETSLSILKPPGHDSYGAFKLEEEILDDQPHKHNVLPTPVSENLLRDVSELISYGKQVLSLSHVTAQSKSSKKSITTYSTQSEHRKKLSSKEMCTKKMEKKVVHPKLCQSSQTQNNSNSASTPSHQSRILLCHETASQEEAEKGKEVKSKAKSDEIYYTHKCSLTLSASLKTLKMPKELRHLLKQYYQYQEKKSKPASLEHLKVTQNFEDRVCKLVCELFKLHFHSSGVQIAFNTYNRFNW